MVTIDSGAHVNLIGNQFECFFNFHFYTIFIKSVKIVLPNRIGNIGHATISNRIKKKIKTTQNYIQRSVVIRSSSLLQSISWLVYFKTVRCFRDI